MSKIMQNLVVLMKPSCLRLGTDTDNTYNISLKGGNMCLNRFCIDEDAAFELSEIRYLNPTHPEEFFQSDRKAKVEGNKSLKLTANWCVYL